MNAAMVSQRMVHHKDINNSINNSNSKDIMAGSSNPSEGDVFSQIILEQGCTQCVHVAAISFQNESLIVFNVVSIPLRFTIILELYLQ